MLKIGYICLSECTLVKMPRCWKSYAAALIKIPVLCNTMRTLIELLNKYQHMPN